MRTASLCALWLALAAAAPGAVAAPAATPAPAAAALPPALQGFVSGLTTYTAEFEQQVQDARGENLAHGHGMLWVQRPGRFRWDYRPAGATQGGGADDGQLLLADGKSLWLYERDLAQATVRDATTAESAAPMLLLSGDATQIDKAFSVSAVPDRDGLRWIEVRPRASAADFARAELAFRGNALERMIISDKLGQKTTLRVTRSQRNPRLDAALFQFTPPPGVDVIGAVRP